MSDDAPFYTPGLKPKTPTSTPGELLFEFYRERDHQFFRCELRDHGRWGVEAQFFEGGDFIFGRRFEDIPGDTRVITGRELAIGWAEAERRAIERGGA